MVELIPLTFYNYEMDTPSLSSTSPSPQPLLLRGASDPMQRLYDRLAHAATTDAPVMLIGETGTGKELCARTLHRMGPRATKPFLPVNCAALPRDLIEAELFGHARGAFTGAIADREGVLDTAKNGIVFLDEIGEMDIVLQAKLLRVLQEGTYTRLGETRLRKTSARFICATNRDPMDLIEQGAMRADLYYRLAVIPLPLPALRHHAEDIPDLAHYFLDHYTKLERHKPMQFSPDAITRLTAYSWPGNVRQLQNVIRHLVIFHPNLEIIECHHLPDALQQARPHIVLPPPPKAFPWVPQRIANDAPPTNTTTIRPLWQVERDIIETAILQCNGNIQQAASALGIAPSTIYRKRLGWQGLPPTPSFEKGHDRPSRLR